MQSEPGLAGLANNNFAERGRVHEIQQDWSQKLLGPGRWARVGVIGEGSCFFHSLCYVTNRDNYAQKNSQDQMNIAHTFRCATFKSKFTPEAYEEFKKTTSSYEKSYDQLMEDFCKPNVWADEVMIKYACKLLGYNILFLDLQAETMYCNVHSKELIDAVENDETLNQPTILVAWVSRSHFEPIVKIINCKEGRLRTIFNGAMDRQDRDTIQYITLAMNSACHLKSTKS